MLKPVVRANKLTVGVLNRGISTDQCKGGYPTGATALHCRNL